MYLYTDYLWKSAQKLIARLIRCVTFFFRQNLFHFPVSAHSKHSIEVIVCGGQDRQKHVTFFESATLPNARLPRYRILYRRDYKEFYRRKKSALSKKRVLARSLKTRTSIISQRRSSPTQTGTFLFTALASTRSIDRPRCCPPTAAFPTRLHVLTPIKSKASRHPPPG